MNQYLRTYKVDLSLPFIPEERTPLFYTPYYTGLTKLQKLKYNQYCAIAVNEQFMYLESEIIVPVLRWWQAHPEKSPVSVKTLETIIKEEDLHFKMFHQFNVRSAPRFFQNGCYFFSSLKKRERKLIQFVGQVRLLYPFLHILITAIEEYSSLFSKAITSEVSTGLGKLERNYARVHASHLEDEVRHVQIESFLSTALFQRLGRFQKAFQFQLFQWILQEITLPKRTNQKILIQLAQDFPDLTVGLKPMRRAVRNIHKDPGFQKLFFDRMPMKETYKALSNSGIPVSKYLQRQAYG